MKFKAAIVLLVVLIASVDSLAADPKLEGAYRFTGLKFQGGGQTDSEAKGMIVVHGKYMAFVKSNVGRQTWKQD
jgi:hypothetical protein